MSNKFFCDELPSSKGDSARRCEHYAKMLFFVLFAQQELSGASFIQSSPKFLNSGPRAPQIFLVCASFVNLRFSIR